MSWENTISELLQDLESISVRFDIQQNLTETQKQTAKDNIEIGATVTQTTGDDYKITLNY